MHIRLAWGAAIGCCLILTGGIHAQVRDFNGSGDGSSWQDAGNWSGSNVPDTTGESPSIDTGGAWNVTLSGPEVSTGQLTLGGDDTLTVSNKLTLSGINALNGELIVSPGANITINSSWQNDGVLTFNEFGFLATPNSSLNTTNNAQGVIRGQIFISGLGFITETLTNHGTISPGFAPNDGKSLALTTDLILTGTSVLDIEIGGGTTNTSFDTIAGLGDVVLGGELQLTQFNGYTPNPSVTLTVVDSSFADGITGSFSNVASGERLTTTDGSGSWLVLYGPGQADSDVVITDYQPTPVLSGDLDGDGFVGIDDLNLVLGNWNQNVPPADPLADPSGDGFVGIDDLNEVLGNWNAGTPPIGTAVPEPGMLSLAGILGVAGLSRRTHARRAL